MRIAMVSSEVSPHATTGGLGEVVASLSAALAARGHEVSVFMPLYRCVHSNDSELLLKDAMEFGDRETAWETRLLDEANGWRLYGVRKEEFFDRRHLYGEGDCDYEDNAERFIFFCRAVLRALEKLDLAPEIVHAHDWQTALLPSLLAARRGARSTSLLTLHNLAFQGVFPAARFALTGLPRGFFSFHGLEFFGQINLLKGGILHADRVNTVSPTYAKEIQTAAFGCGLEGVLSGRPDKVAGILNGIDPSRWDPATDAQILETFDAKDLSGKAACKLALARELGLRLGRVPAPLFAMVARLTAQKGLDALLDALPELVEMGAKLVLLGSGSAEYEDALRAAAARHKGSVAARIGFDEGLARRIFAGSDFFLMPSFFEPCGLSHMQAMRYGGIPVVRATGGLEDSVVERKDGGSEATGIKFAGAGPKALLHAAHEAIRIFRDPDKLSTMRAAAMRADFSWSKSAQAYETLYASLKARD
ncbi:MAG: glycogen synthase GlgA [Verrucomicrobiae bacterium]|nr:glycogen synthase GlgA [Verrucomicrobiae bacterium]